MTSFIDYFEQNVNEYTKKTKMKNTSGTGVKELKTKKKKY